MDHCLPQFDAFKKRLLNSSQPIPLDEAEQMVEAIYTGHCIDTTDRFHNLFFYEICPLTLIASHLGLAGTKISFTGKAERYDGVLYCEPSKEGQKVEMTSAIDGHQDAIRMECLRRHGHAPAFQKIDYDGTKNNRKFKDADLIAVKSEDYDKETLLPLMHKAFNQKHIKSSQNNNYSNA